MSLAPSDQVMDPRACICLMNHPENKRGRPPAITRCDARQLCVLAACQWHINAESAECQLRIISTSAMYVLFSETWCETFCLAVRLFSRLWCVGMASSTRHAQGSRSR